jgi:hypothetical protein
MMRTSRFVAALCSIALLACQPQERSGHTSDPSPSISTPSPAVDEGDARLRSGDAAPGYLDLVGARVTAADAESLRFVEDVAAPLPSNSRPPKGDAAIGWSFCLDTDPTSAGVGYPMKGVQPCEFVLRVIWNGKRLRGFFIDRRPLIGGGYSFIEMVEPTWLPRSMQVVIPLEMLGYPERFEWSASTEEVVRERPGRSLDQSLRSEAIYVVDELPEGGISAPATWRAE